MILIEGRDGNEYPIEGLLFDMDGTIVDSVAATERIWADWAREHGVLDRLVIEHGRPAEITVRSALPHLEGEEFDRVVRAQQAREAADVEGVAPIAGAHQLLAWLTEIKLPWAVVTSADVVLARARLEACGFEPDILVTRDDVEHGKPHPEPFLLGAQLIGVHATRCLVVEDSAAGLESGRAAGSRTASVGRTDGDLAVRDMADLLDVLIALRT